MPEQSNLEGMSLGQIVKEVAYLAVTEAVSISNSTQNIGRPHSYHKRREARQEELYQELDRREKIYRRYDN